MALDLHEKKQEQENLEEVAETSFREVTNKIVCEDEAQENIPGYNGSRKEPLLKTCKFTSNKGMLFPV